jgi:glycosyltransferase involved in cell wall biosynthesis
MLANQGYTRVSQLIFREKRVYDVLFIGKYEAHRQRVIKHLAKAGIRIAVGGAGWRNKKQIMNEDRVTFLGDDFRGSQYQDLLSKSKICLGLLSKEFPELHTTRTFEIPYFGSVLATERNKETSEYFDECQGLFYDTLEELTLKINEILQNGRWIEMARAGQQRVLNSSYSWEDQMAQVIKRIERL